MVVAFEKIEPVKTVPSFEDVGGVVEQRRTERELLENFIFSDKPIEDWLPTEQAEVASGILDSFDNPEKERVDLTSALLLSDMFGVDINTTAGLQPQMMQEIFGDELVRISEKFKKEPIEGGFFSKIAESWRRGDAQVSSDIAIYEAAFEGKGDEIAAMEARSKMLLEQQLSPIESSFMSGLFYSSAEVLPGMARGYWSAIPLAFTGMATGAGMALAAGQVPPLTLALEEVGTVPTGALIGLKAGFVAGSALFWYKQGAGSMFATMTEQGYDRELSMNIAGVAAIPYAIVEFMQVSQLTPGLRQGILKTAQTSMMKVLGQAAKRYGTTWTVEVVEEVIQEIIQIVAEDTAGFMSEKLDMPEGVTEFIMERARRTWETTKEAGKAMALLPIPGAAIDIRTGTKGLISAEKKAKIDKKLAELPPTPPVKPVVPEVPTEGVIAPEKPVEAPPAAEVVEPQKQIEKVEPIVLKLKDQGELGFFEEETFISTEQSEIDATISEVRKNEGEQAANIVKSLLEKGIQTESTHDTATEIIVGVSNLSTENKSILQEAGLTVEPLPPLSGEFIRFSKVAPTPPAAEVKPSVAEEIEVKPAVETELGDEEFALEETGMSNKQRNSQIRKFRKMVREHPIYKQALAGAEDIPDMAGVFNVQKTEIGDVKARFDGVPGLMKKFKVAGPSDTSWDKRAQELGIEGSLNDFMDIVESWYESRQTEGVFNTQAYQALVESGEPDADLTVDIIDLLEAGESPQEINTRIRQFAKKNKLTEQDVKEFMVQEMTDEQRKSEFEIARERDRKVAGLEAERLPKEKLRGAEQEKLKKILTGQERLRAEVEAREKRKTKLRSQIHAVAAKKGLSKKKLSELKKKHAGFRTLTGKVAVKKIDVEQLEALLKAVQKARPTQVAHKKVLTKKQENKIASLRENLIRQKQLTEADYADILKREARGKEAMYIDAQNFITIEEARNVIKRIHNQAEITRVTEAREAAVRKNPEIAQHVDAIDKAINDKRAETKRDPWQFESMRYYNEQMELKTGAPFYALYQDITDTYLESTKTRTARLQQLANETEGFKDIAQDDKALERVSLYISSQSRLKTPVPQGVTAEEKALAKNIQKIFKEYENKARWTRFYWWYVTGIDNESRQQGPYPIGDYDQNKQAIAKAVDIYESKGKDAVVKYLNTQDWGIIKSGYEPLENIVQKVRLYKPKPTTVGKTHIEVRTAVEYHKQERNVIARLGSYMRQMDMLNDLSPKINAYVQLFEDNQNKFNNPGRVKESIESWLKTVKRYNIEGGFWERAFARIYAQSMRSVIMDNPVLAFRNTFQPVAFEHDKSILFDPRNESLTGKDIEFLETYVQQQRAIIEEFFMLGEKPLPGLTFVSQLVEKVKLYPLSDVMNRRWTFWGKINQVRRALKEDTTAEMMDEAKFSDITNFEQRMALSILASEGEDAMARYVSRIHVANIHWLYERSQRSPVEMGGMGRVFGNLMLFGRSYGEKLARETNKFMTAKDYATQWRAAKVLFSVIAGGMLAGALYKKITGRKKNPYNPFVILSWRPGGLAQAAMDAVGVSYSELVQGIGGDTDAQGRFLNSLPGLADMFIPFYDIVLRGIEAITDQKSIDYRFVRQVRAAIDSEYKVRGGTFKVRRNAIEKWQYFVGGAGVDQKSKKKKPIITIGE